MAPRRQLNPERWAPLPPELLGGLNVAWSGLGGAAVNPLSVDTASSEEQMFNGVSPTGYAWRGDVASLPLEVTVDLAGDEPVPVAGITLLTLNMDGFVGEGLREFDLELSVDGVTFEPALSGELAPLAVEQAFVLDSPTEASYARLRVRSAAIASASYATIARVGGDRRAGLDHARS